jgi:hypothetical protein
MLGSDESVGADLQEGGSSAEQAAQERRAAFCVCRKHICELKFAAGIDPVRGRWARDCSSALTFI